MKNKTKIGYKVVAEDEAGRLTSASRDIYCSLTYSFYLATKRLKGYGPLAVFKKEQDAIRFALISDRLVYKCKYVPSGNKSLWTPSKKFGSRSSKYPRGTTFANEVILTPWI